MDGVIAGNEQTNRKPLAWTSRLWISTHSTGEWNTFQGALVHRYWPAKVNIY